MSARYIMRMDDACPTIDSARWARFEGLFDELGIKPIVAVVPDNQDPDLHRNTPDQKFWDRARAWQDNNYVRSDKLLLIQKQGQMIAEGTVQSVLYNAKKKDKGKESSVPVYASSQKMFYNRENRLLRYEDNVDIRQGTDRITAGLANIYMNEKNEMSQTVAEKEVVITQPNRRAVGDWAQYTSETEVAVLRGNPAKIEDAESGTSQGAQVTVFMRENRVVGESKTEQNNTGRTRTVYKVKKSE